MEAWITGTTIFLYTSLFLYVLAIGCGKVDHFKYYQTALAVATIFIMLSLIGYVIVDWQYFDWKHVQ